MLSTKPERHQRRRSASGLVGLCFVASIIIIIGHAGAVSCPSGFQLKLVTERVCSRRNPTLCEYVQSMRCQPSTTTTTTESATTVSTTTTTNTNAASGSTSAPRAESSGTNCQITYIKDCQEDRAPRCTIAPKRICDEDQITATTDPKVQLVQPVMAKNNTSEALSPILDKLAENCKIAYAKECIQGRKPECQIVPKGCENGEQQMIPPILARSVDKPDSNVEEECTFIYTNECRTVGERKICEPKKVKSCRPVASTTTEQPSYQRTFENVEPVCVTETKKECSYIRGREVCSDSEVTKCDNPSKPKGSSYFGPSSIINLFGSMVLGQKKVCPPPQRKCTPVTKCEKSEAPVCRQGQFESCEVTVMRNQYEICHNVINKYCRTNSGVIQPTSSDYQSVQCQPRPTQVCNTHYVMESNVVDKQSCIHVPQIECAPAAFSLKGENCTQVLRQVCRRFPVQEPNPRPVTTCENVQVAKCSAVDAKENRIRSSEDSVVCRDEESHLCGIQETKDLTYGQCFTETKQHCTSPKPEVCTEVGQNCQLVSYNEDGTVCSNDDA